MASRLPLNAVTQPFRDWHLRLRMILEIPDDCLNGT